MGMLSPMLRNILGSLCSLDICMLFLPDFQLHTVEKVLELLLSLQWKDKVITLTEEQVELLTCLDIQPGEISRVEAEDKVTINTPELSLSSCPLCDADIVDSVEEHINREHECTGTNTKNSIISQRLKTPTLNQFTPLKNVNPTQNHIPSTPGLKTVNKTVKENIPRSKVTKVPNVNIINTQFIIPTSNVDKTITKSIQPTLDKSSLVPETTTPSPNIASPTITTTQPVSMVNITHTVKCPICYKTYEVTRQKTKLKCHIGFVHYSRQTKEDIERLFEGNKCTVCMKDCVEIVNKGKHIILKHCKYVEDILSATNEAMKANDIVTNETNCKKTKDEYRASDLRLVPIYKLTEQTMVSPSKHNSNIDQYTTTSPKLTQQTTDKSNHVPETSSNVNAPALPVSMVNIAHTVKCLKCSKTFVGTSQEKGLKCHIGFVHYGQKIKKKIDILFEGNKCTVCKKNFVKFRNRWKHLIWESL